MFSFSGRLTSEAAWPTVATTSISDRSEEKKVLKKPSSKPEEPALEKKVLTKKLATKTIRKVEEKKKGKGKKAKQKNGKDGKCSSPEAKPTTEGAELPLSKAEPKKSAKRPIKLAKYVVPVNANDSLLQYGCSKCRQKGCNRCLVLNFNCSIVAAAIFTLILMHVPASILPRPRQ